MKRLIALYTIPYLILMLASSLIGSDIKETDDMFYPAFLNDKDMIIPKAEKKPFTFSYGGWLMPIVIDERNGDGKNELLSSITIGKLWVKSWLWERSAIYLRVKDVYTGILREKNIDIDNSDNLFDLDVGYWSISNSNNTLKLYIGRKFFIIGTGLIFNGRGDGCQFDLNSKYVDFRLIGVYSGYLKKDNNPYNLSDKDISDGSKRIFTGGTISKIIYNQKVYLFGLAQIDKGKDSAGIKSKYNSEYYGLGFTGVFQNAYYFGEFIHERGKSYLSDPDPITGLYEKQNIYAFAAVFGLQYYLNLSYNPVLLLNYAYASSDKNRINYQSPSGNESGKDNGFIYFGTYVGGYALRPLLSNIHVMRCGLSILPFYNSKRQFLKRMNLIIKHSYYYKNDSNSGINSGEALLNSRDIGHGDDVMLRWKIFYDLSAYVNYAIFIPGNAYPSSEENRYFFMGGLIISF
ncbi:MAG: alginate export family protein [Spirochaetota bacterium]|nr:alginate export family protein [Spirochaetota bacterium]